MSHKKITAKICGIKTPEALGAAVRGGARFVGFVFFPPSPRHVAIDTAKALALMLPTGVRSVGLFVDPTDAQLDAVTGRVQLDMIQLHGAETPQRVAEIKGKYALPIIKAFSVSHVEDIALARAYEDHVDWLLFDAKPPADSDVPGGTGQSFDWVLLQGLEFSKPWMLSGGLNAENVEQALSVLSPDAVDVSSGVESVRGEKDIEKIRAFLAAVKTV
ncbi:MAG: phosphoribosylanthranilate isomerase [Alphaproteobacteria bacterium]|nr:MAG: phosphoribosylanthranilate isomerase [Alphaproteobacteria bacterium]